MVGPIWEAPAEIEAYAYSKRVLDRIVERRTAIHRIEPYDYSRLNMATTRYQRTDC
jgi:hypothetical protein